MKVALLTYWGADNYGATLQAYATIKALQEIGHEAQLINLLIDEPKRSWIKNLLLYPKHLKFNSFRKQYFTSVTSPYISLKELQNNPPQADYYMVGSDQTWNPDISKDKTPVFFLDFGYKNVKKITYAASFGKDKWETSEWISDAEVQQLLSQFEAIAVRENTGVQILKRFGVNSIQVLDPVLLFENYPELVGKPQDNPEIILYKLVNTNEFYEKAKIIGHQFDLKVRSIGSIRRVRGIKCAYPESIPAWMNRIASGQYVITDSFHGTVISLLYGKQFVVCVGNPKLVTRIKSLLSLVGLEERIMNVGDPVEQIMQMMKKPIDYNKVNEILASERNKSKEYLKKIII